MQLITLALLSLLRPSIAYNDTRQYEEDTTTVGLRGPNKPIRAVRKMSNDEGEKFFPDYWLFHDSQALTGDNTTATATDHWGMKARSYPFQPAIPVQSGRGRGLSPRAFQCPTDTHGCTAIDRPSSCCGGGETCEIIQDTGSGDVGCCAQGRECAGIVGACQVGHTACPGELGGGCCIPGYECVSGGCAYVSTVTVTIHSTVMLSTKTYSTSTPTTDPTDGLAPPARPTSLSTTTTSPSSSGSSSSSPSESSETICPIGFYGCSAVYHGGCCRTGRNCDTTSCPTTSSTTLTSNDQTIVVPVDPTAAETGGGGTGTGQCASGWFSCADTVGGGCCPNGFACGSSCTASGSVSATAAVAKNHPESTAAGVSGKNAGRQLLGMSVLAIVWMW